MRKLTGHDDMANIAGTTIFSPKPLNNVLSAGQSVMKGQTADRVKWMKEHILHRTLAKTGDSFTK